VVALAVETVDGCDAAGILSARRDAEVTSTSATGDDVRRSDALQDELREGPCFHSLWTNNNFESPDLLVDERWPRYGPAAAALGLRSAMGIRLSNEEELGALNLYSYTPHAFGERTRQTGAVIAALSAVAMGWYRTDAQLRDAIDTRQVIGEATGILMQREGLTAERAFELLVKGSNRTNTKLAVLAEQIVRESEQRH